MKAKRRRPGQRAGLAKEDVLSAARAMVEGAGIGALTMRSLATRLGIAPNAVYSHFSDKRSLIDGLLDDLLGDIELPDDRSPWTGSLMRLMTSSRRLVADHPELVPFFLSRPGSGPNAQRLGAAVLGLLARGGIAGPAAGETLQILLVFSIGFAAFEAPRRTRPPAHGGKHPDDATFATGLRWLIEGARSASRLLKNAR